MCDGLPQEPYTMIVPNFGFMRYQNLRIIKYDWIYSRALLTHFMPLISFYIPGKHGFLMFSEGVSKEISGMKWVK